VWTTSDKLIGTLLFPGGLAVPILGSVMALPFAVTAGTSDGCVTEVRPGGVNVTSCPPSSPELWSQVLWYAVLAALILVPIGTAIYLGRRAFRT
ncbi:MAG: hypothetical protein M3345_06810, partial [Actinomycetota bacterium]|nr:hypothetical protein [Actinomycetota bacterium]